GEEGDPVALENRCAHRFAPLHMGKKTAGGVQCPYHGLQYNHDGLCVHNPVGDGHIPAGTRVDTFPIVERHRILWIWMGDPSRADDAVIPDMSLIPAEGDGHQNLGNYLHVRANYLLEIDNLMDLSHVNFLHIGSLGHETMRVGEIEVTEDDRRIRADLWMPNTICAFGELEGQPSDQWQNMIWMPPSSMLLEFGTVLPGADPVQPPDQYAFHIVTPETERTTHYFFGTSGKYPDEQRDFADFYRQAQNRAFLEEDNPMIEAVDAEMNGEDFWTLRPAILPSDKAAIRVRRRLEKMCREEARAD
ncbi:MAG: aromatic ring-hydroxylating dioxygenase subunit alpha, partial [Parasphingopyxis sp.]|uniref:aromatic ring-hydroxylating dioxygenase subunit alpha n=1 Tax=Parasphingopyxis sp. TaxID=1920299 RepID=UPI0032EF5A2C